jgi:hypothetical protein
VYELTKVVVGPFTVVVVCFVLKFVFAVVLVFEDDLIGVVDEALVTEGTFVEEELLVDILLEDVLVAVVEGVLLELDFVEVLGVPVTTGVSQAPVTDGTASGPISIGTMFVPQST